MFVANARVRKAAKASNIKGNKKYFFGKMLTFNSKRAIIKLVRRGQKNTFIYVVGRQTSNIYKSHVEISWMILLINNIIFTSKIQDIFKQKILKGGRFYYGRITTNLL